MSNDETELLNVGEVALALGCSGPTVRGLIAEGTIPVIQLGGKRRAVRVRRADVDKLLEARPRAA